MSANATPASDLEMDDDSGVDGLDRRQVLRRLAVGGAIVWSAPLISKTAFAAGPTSCVTNTVDFNAYATGSSFTSATVGGITMTLAAPTFFGGSSALGTNHTIIGSPIGGFASKGLRFEQNAVTNGGQNIKLTFSQAVYAVTFTITDIDNSTGNWTDRIEIISPAAYTYSVPSGSTVTGTGTAADRFRNSQTNLNYNNSSPGGNLTLNFTGPLTEFEMTFRCAGQQSSNQLINFTNISFCG